MKSSVTKAIGFWSILFVAICILCAVSAYFFTAHQSQWLRELISDNAEQLASPIPTLAGEPAKLSPSRQWMSCYLILSNTTPLTFTTNAQALQTAPGWSPLKPNPNKQRCSSLKLFVLNTNNIHIFPRQKA